MADSTISMSTRHVTMRANRRLLRDGFRVLRFWNNEVDRNLDGVLMSIDTELRSTPPGGPADRHPPPSGEG
jgi:very-short-patch-repair endonuclease